MNAVFIVFLIYCAFKFQLEYFGCGIKSRFDNVIINRVSVKAWAIDIVLSNIVSRMTSYIVARVMLQLRSNLYISLIAMLPIFSTSTLRSRLPRLSVWDLSVLTRIALC